MNSELKFPTLLHEQVAESAFHFFHSRAEVDTVLVVNSCARGQAVPESDLDMAVLLLPNMSEEGAAHLEAEWQHERSENKTLHDYLASSKLAHLHLDLIRGKYTPQVWDDGGGPDGFELEIGNQVAYAAPMHAVGEYYRQLQAQWLPYYPEDLRLQRLGMARNACLYDLDHIPFFVRRGLYFQAFDRLYKGYQEFLQAVFISRKVYPLAYNKWIRLQVEDWLALPELYRALPPILSVRNMESDELIEKAKTLTGLLEQWVR